MKQQQYYILSDSNTDICRKNCFANNTITVIAYLYYSDLVSYLCTYINRIPSYIRVVIISSNNLVFDEIRKHIVSTNMNIKYINKPNVGRDVSALLVTSKQYVESSDYVCFLHDKKEHQNMARIQETKAWLDNIWQNTLASKDYIENVIELFEQNDKIGVLAVPQPLGLFFDTWAGQGWYESYEGTCELAKKIGLNIEIIRENPPITIGTALWFRPKALKKLFEYKWNYDDFDDDKLIDGRYLSYAVERIFSFVADDAGYKTGIIMTSRYAEQQTALAQVIMTMYSNTLKNLLGISLGAECKQVLNCFERFNSMANNNTYIYLYGAGRWGRVCLKLLRLVGKEPKCFVVTKNKGKNAVDNIPVIEIDNIHKIEDNAEFIVTVSDPNMKEDITSILNERNYKYFCFWE